MRKHILLFCLFVAFTGSLSAQTYKAFMAAAENAYTGKDYYSALSYYMEASEFDKADLSLDYKIAESARQFDSYDIAKDYYKKVMDADENNDFPMSSFWLANVHQLNGDYAEAKSLYQLYLSENNGDDPFFTKKAQKEVQACDWSIELIEEYADSEEFKIDQLGKEVNTSYSEFGALSKSDTLYYSSLRFKNRDDSHKPKRPLSHILTSINGEKGKRVNRDFAVKDKHIAHTTFNSKNTHIIYTVCEYVDISDIRCDLYTRQKDEDGKWVMAKKLDSPVNIEGQTSTQPATGILPSTGKEVLYFVSDREGGKGGLDIWYSVFKDDGSFGAPINLAEVNTAEDDISPFYHENLNKLFFSSTGYQGLGGFDVYELPSTNGKWDKVAHLGAQINSSYNDIYYSLASDGETAYLSSNRSGAAYVDKKNKACCNDIYKVSYQELDIKLLAKTFNKLSREDLVGTTVRVIDLSMPNAEPITLTNMEDNDFEFLLDKGKKYMIIADKIGFVSDTVEVSTENVRKSKTINKELYLKPDFLDLDVLTFDKDSKNALNGATVTVIDLTDNTIKSVVITNIEGNNFNFNLSRGHDYRIIASRKGYKPSTITLNTSDYQNDGKIIKKLYLERGGLDNFLPLILFFDNDRPDRKTVSPTTNKSYNDTYGPYYAKKDTYKRIHTSPLRGNEKENSMANLENFFENRLKKGHEDLNAFLNELLDMLKSGEKIKIGIRGYASPIASTKYNELLGHRRVSSVYNEMKTFNGGVLRSFLDSGALSIEEKSLGEITAPNSVSSNEKDIRKSIYSVEASEERRVEIIEVEKL